MPNCSFSFCLAVAHFIQLSWNALEKLRLHHKWERDAVVFLVLYLNVLQTKYFCKGTLALSSCWVFNVTWCHVHASFISLFLQGNGWGRCTSLEMLGREFFIFSFVIYFQYFFDCLRLYKMWWVQECVWSSYVEILCLVFYMLKLFFQKITWRYAIWDINKDVQNKVLNVYCTLYSVCLIRRVNV